MRRISGRHLVPQVRWTPVGLKALKKPDLSPKQKPLASGALAVSSSPKVRWEGLQWATGWQQSWDTVGMLKQHHQSHRDLSLSELVLPSQGIGATGRDFTSALTTPPLLCGDTGQGRFWGRSSFRWRRGYLDFNPKSKTGVLKKQGKGTET